MQTLCLGLSTRVTEGLVFLLALMGVEGIFLLTFKRLKCWGGGGEGCGKKKTNHTQKADRGDKSFQLKRKKVIPKPCSPKDAEYSSPMLGFQPVHACCQKSFLERDWSSVALTKCTLFGWETNPEQGAWHPRSLCRNWLGAYSKQSVLFCVLSLMHLSWKPLVKPVHALPPLTAAHRNCGLSKSAKSQTNSSETRVLWETNLMLQQMSIILPLL